MSKLVILCPFCNAPYTAKMQADFDYSMGSEETGIYGEEITLEIYCNNCGKLVYKKNAPPYDFDREGEGLLTHYEEYLPTAEEVQFIRESC